jgi:hypothetical protein
MCDKENEDKYIVHGLSTKFFESVLQVHMKQ